MAHDFLAEVVTKKGYCCGCDHGVMGHDTLFLAKPSQASLLLISRSRLWKAQERLDQAGMTNAQLILQGP